MENEKKFDVCSCCKKIVSRNTASAHARRVWENAYGYIPSIPKSFLVVYHKDGNPWNNDLGNLMLLTKKGLAAITALKRLNKRINRNK